MTEQNSNTSNTETSEETINLTKYTIGLGAIAGFLIGWATRPTRGVVSESLTTYFTKLSDYLGGKNIGAHARYLEEINMHLGINIAICILAGLLVGGLIKKLGGRNNVSNE